MHHIIVLLSEKCINYKNICLKTCKYIDYLMRLRKANNGFVIISTSKYIGEGFDEKKLNALFIVSPFSCIINIYISH